MCSHINTMCYFPSTGTVCGPLSFCCNWGWICSPDPFSVHQCFLKSPILEAKAFFRDFSTTVRLGGLIALCWVEDFPRVYINLVTRSSQLQSSHCYPSCSWAADMGRQSVRWSLASLTPRSRMRLHISASIRLEVLRLRQRQGAMQAPEKKWASLLMSTNDRGWHHRPQTLARLAWEPFICQTKTSSWTVDSPYSISHKVTA